ncbi:MAG: HNH endonuclease [Myxococcaceae bacterium]|nr:HNH endonuclease [Myxococcaceae bacterium]
MVTLRLAMTPDEEATYEAALDGLREAYGSERPEWFYLAVMAKHFLDMHADADDRVKRTLSRKVIRRDNYTCAVPECLQRGGLEADHIRLRSRGGADTMENLTSLCAADHRYGKHTVGRLRLHGRAPHDLIVRMGSRVYRKDTLISPPLDEGALAEDPWAGGSPS